MGKSLAAKFAIRSLFAIIFFMPLFSCSKGPAIGLAPRALAPCPSSPNCVLSDSEEKEHAIAPFVLTDPGAKAWSQIRAIVASLPRTKVVVDGENYLRAESRSFVFRFVDDLELELRPSQGAVAVRSAARVGYYDFGVNRRRVEKLRSLLEERKLIQPPQSSGENIRPPR